MVRLTALDPGIRDAVVWLRERGWETTDSGDGVSKCEHGMMFAFPHVFMVAEGALREEADRLDASVRATPEVFPGQWRVEANYSPGEVGVLMLFRPPS